MAKMAQKLEPAAPAPAAGWCIMAAMAAFLLLPGCAEVRDMVGFSREGPDEFSVITHQPLVIPPDFDLRPPRPGGDEAERNRAKDAAEEALFSGSDAPADAESAITEDDSQPATAAPAPSGGLTAGEEALLQQLSGTQTQAEQQSSSQDAMADIAAGGDSIVDARAEAERLRANEEAGAAPTEGATPVLEDESEGSLLDAFWDLF